MPEIKLRLLGSPRIEVDSLLIRVETRKVMALFVYLAVMGESYRRDSLVNLLWPEYDLTRGRAVLRRTLSALNSALPENCLVSDRETIGLSPQIDLWLDVREFRQCLNRCRSHGHAEGEVCPDCLPELTHAIDLYRDDFMSGFTLIDSFNFDDWQFFQAEALRQEFGNALGKLVQCLVLLGEFEPAIQMTRRRLAVDRLNEEVHSDLMRLYAWMQQRNAALRQFEECKKTLRSQLGVEPQKATIDLAQAIETGGAPPPPTDPAWGKSNQPGKRRDLSAKSTVTAPVIRQPDLSILEPTSIDHALPADGQKSSQASGQPDLALSESIAVEEKRMVTAIFFELCQPADLGDEEDSLEERSGQVGRFLERIGIILDQYGGQIESRVGDSLLVVFGLAHRRENDAELALRAALEIQRESSRYGLSIATGIATGEVFSRPDDLPEDEALKLAGNTIDTALFLAGQAPADEIYTAESTYQFTRDAFVFTPLALPAKRKGVHGLAFRVERLLPRAQKTRGIQGMRSPMVGRDHEMEALQHALEKVLAGSGQLVVVMGEAGVGKSRLVEEFSQQAWRTVGTDGLRWLEGRCLELSKDVSYWPFLDLMKVDFGWLAQEDSQENLTQVEKAVRRLVSSEKLSIESGKEIEAVLYHLLSLRSEPCGEDPLAVLSPDEIRQRSFLALRDYLMALARSQPLALIFEDLHWADPLSLDLIYFLMDSLSQVRILLISVYRPGQEYRTHHFLNVAGQKCRQCSTEIHLRDLSQEQSTQMIHFLLGESRMAGRMMALIWERCQGNPFYIEELIHSLIESGTIKSENGGWRMAETMDTHELPASIQSVILSRLDHLDEDYRQVLLAAAVIGRVFSKKVLQQALPGIKNLENTLWELEDRGLVYQERTIPEVEYSFRHVLMREAIYHNCLYRRRKILHLSVAQAIERIYSERLEEHFEQLAYHYEKSGNSLKAIDYLEKAGEKAALHFANEAAITSFTKGLELLRSLPDTVERNQRELGFLTALGVPLVHARGHADEQVLEVYTQARDLCQKIEDNSHLFDVLLGLRRYELSFGHLPKAIHLDRQMLALGENHNNPAECARACMMLSESAYYIADFGTLLVHSRKGLSLCKDYNAPTHIKLYGNDSRLGCEMLLPLALWMLGYPDQALAELRREQEILEGVSHPFSRVMGLCFASKGYQLLRQVQVVQSLVEEGLQISREHGYTLFQNLGLVQLGWSLAAQNQFESGIDNLKQGIDELKRLKLMVFVPESIAPLSEALAWSGQYQESRAAIEEGIAIAEAMGIIHWLAEMVRLKGEALWKLGDISGAEDSFKQAIEIARKQQAHSWELRAAASLARLWQEQGEGAKAAALLTPVYHWFSEGYGTPDLINARTLMV